MATSDVEICNSALSKIGADTITSLSDNTRRAKLCNNMYNKIRKRLMRAHPWNFAMKRQALAEQSEVVTSGNISTGADILTVTAHPFETGESVEMVFTGTSAAVVDGYSVNTQNRYESDSTGSKVLYVNDLTANTFSLHPTVADATSNTNALDFTSGGSGGVTITSIPAFEYAKKFKVPTDMLRAVREEHKETAVSPRSLSVNGEIDWKVEGDFILTNETTFNLLYIADISDTTKFDESFDELFALDLARDLAYPLVQSISLKQELEREYREKLRDIRSFDGQEGSPEDLTTDLWLSARL